MRRITSEHVVIGSGAGGSTAFEHLSALGKDVLMLEEGLDRRGFKVPGERLASDIFLRDYRYGGAQPVFGPSPFAFGEGVILGGTTELNGGLFWRTPEWVMRQWRSNGLFPGMTDDDINSVFESLESDLQVGFSPNQDGYDFPSRLLKAGAIANRKTVVEVPRAGGHLCKRSNECAIGCPRGAKQSMSATLIPRGVGLGGQIMPGYRVLKLVSSRGLVKSAIARELETGSLVEIFGKHFFLSAGPLQSPGLISRSGGPKTFPVEFHLNAKILVEFDEAVNPEKSTIFTQQVQSHIAEGIVYMATALTRDFVGLELSLVSSGTMRDVLENLSNMAMYTVQVRAATRGRIYFPTSHPLIIQNLTETDSTLLRKSITLLAEDVFAAGAKRLWLPGNSRAECSSVEIVRETLAKTSRRDWQLSSVHAMASLPLSESPDSLFDLGGRNRTYRNLWSIDAASLPSAVGESPQGSIMALARANMRTAFS